MASVNRRVLPGFSLSLGYTVFYLSVLVLLPLAACFFRAGSLSFDEFWGAVWTERARAAYLAHVRRLVRRGIHQPVSGAARRLGPGPLRISRQAAGGFARSTCRLPCRPRSAGSSTPTLYVPTGWLGQYLVPLGIEAAYSRLAIVLVLIFIGLPFVVRTVQPVLEELDAGVRGSRGLLGATRLQTFRTRHPARCSIRR